jgi:hypothetical protein
MAGENWPADRWGGPATSDSAKTNPLRWAQRAVTYTRDPRGAREFVTKDADRSERSPRDSPRDCKGRCLNYQTPPGPASQVPAYPVGGARLIRQARLGTCSATRCRLASEPRARYQTPALAHPARRIPGPLARQFLVPAPLEPTEPPTPRTGDRRLARLGLVPEEKPPQQAPGHPDSFLAVEAGRPPRRHSESIGDGDCPPSLRLRASPLPAEGPRKEDVILQDGQHPPHPSALHAPTPSSFGTSASSWLASGPPVRTPGSATRRAGMRGGAYFASPPAGL